GETLVLLVPRNYGHELERLVVNTGAAAWPRPRVCRGEDIDLSHSALDDSALYLVADKLLRAIALADGKNSWEVPLTGGTGGWRACATMEFVLVHPRAAQLEFEASSVYRRLLPLDMAALLLVPYPLGAGRPWTTAAAVGQQLQTP